jgi:hypothetical protein
MQVITQNPIIYSNASGDEAKLDQKVRDTCGNRPNQRWHPKKARAYDKCRENILKGGTNEKLKAESKGTPKPKKDETKTTGQTQTQTQTQTTTDTTQDSSKGKKMLLIGGGVLVLIVIAVVVLKNRNN